MIGSFFIFLRLLGNPYRILVYFERPLSSRRATHDLQSGSAGCSAHDVTNVLSMQDKSCNDHKCEEDVECKANRKVWGTEVDCRVKGFDSTVCSRGLVNEEDPRRYTGGVSLMS